MTAVTAPPQQHLRDHCLVDVCRRLLSKLYPVVCWAHVLLSQWRGVEYLDPYPRPFRHVNGNGEFWGSPDDLAKEH